MASRRSYTLIAPIYDALVRAPLQRARRESLAQLPRDGEATVLVCGIGTGLDAPFLPRGHRYVGLDLTPAMLARARPRVRELDLELIRADCLQLPFSDRVFDYVVLHLIVAVVNDPSACLAEAVRVAKPGATLLILDKFLRRGEAAWLRQAINPVARRIATQTNVVLEDLLERVPAVQVLDNRPALLGGWFRLIRLRKR